MSSPEELDRYMRALLRRQRDGERLTVEIGPHTALALVGLMQWAMRHDDTMAHTTPAMFQDLLAELRRAFADEPTALAMLNLPDPP